MSKSSAQSPATSLTVRSTRTRGLPDFRGHFNLTEKTHHGTAHTCTTVVALLLIGMARLRKGKPLPPTRPRPRCPV